MRLKVFLLTLKYMGRVVLGILLMMATIGATVFVIKELTGDTEFGFIVFFAVLGLGGLLTTCYDMAKSKVDNENRDLMEQLARKQ
jgi:hypothetical protein